MYCIFYINQILKIFWRIQNLCPDLCTAFYVEKDQQYHQQYLHLRHSNNGARCLFWSVLVFFKYRLEYAGRCPITCNLCNADKTIGDWFIPAPNVTLLAGSSEHILNGVFVYCDIIIFCTLSSSLFLYRNLPIPPVLCRNTAGHSCMYLNVFAGGTAGSFPAGSAQDDEGNDIGTETTIGRSILYLYEIK